MNTECSEIFIISCKSKKVKYSKLNYVEDFKQRMYFFTQQITVMELINIGYSLIVESQIHKQRFQYMYVA